MYFKFFICIVKSKESRMHATKFISILIFCLVSQAVEVIDFREVEDAYYTVLRFLLQFLNVN